MGSDCIAIHPSALLNLDTPATKLIQQQAIPEHMRPSPVKPGLQMQLKFPTVLTQDAFLLQVCMPLLHSSTSGNYRIQTQLEMGSGSTAMLHLYLTWPNQAPRKLIKLEPIPEHMRPSLVKPRITNATEVSNCINAGRILAAVVNTTATFIDIWRLKNKNTVGKRWDQVVRLCYNSMVPVQSSEKISKTAIYT